MLRLMMFLFGFGLSTIGFIYIITYLNYLTIGYSWKDYFYLVFTKPECFLAFIGIILLCIVIFTRGNDNDVRI